MESRFAVFRQNKERAIFLAVEQLVISFYLQLVL
jgi:hypothetical protein